ncbi:hypothetical protein DRJ25_00905 [Candidatus Woesearchaeota archaeon]|nr:MAG: hypothetical protein DRJ25_00905 [Candidatus Woesearchaeota archaeon]
MTIMTLTLPQSVFEFLNFINVWVIYGVMNAMTYTIPIINGLCEGVFRCIIFIRLFDSLVKIATFISANDGISMPAIM